MKLSASTMNLVVWIDDPERRQWIVDRAALVSEKHPSFTVVLDRTGHAPPGAVSLHGGDRDSTRTVQAERVTIDVSNEEPHAIADYIAAHCPTNVPTVVWWTGTNVADKPHFDALLPYAATLIVDASGGTTDASTLRSLVRFHREHRNVALRDLAWLRLRPWREMIAQFFDDPRVVDELFDITALHVTSGSEAEALYLGGWLASRLGWSAEGHDAFGDRQGKPVAFHHERRGEIRRIVSLCLDSSTSWYHGEVTDDPDVVRFWVEGKHARPPRLFTLVHVDSASLLESAVLERGPDEPFEMALRSAGTLIG